MASEMQLKYGCNPNQKPSRIFMKNGGETAGQSLVRTTGLYQFIGRFKRLGSS